MLIRIALVAVLLSPDPGLAVVKCTTPDGKVVYQDMPCAKDDTAKPVLILKPAAPVQQRSYASTLTRGDHELLRQAREREAETEGKLLVGMTSESVQRVLGTPDRVNASIRPTGKWEQWVYRKKDARGRILIGDTTYVYLSNDRVASWAYGESK
jgi:hypothetical protein